MASTLVMQGTVPEWLLLQHYCSIHCYDHEQVVQTEHNTEECRLLQCSDYSLSELI